jgi:hypothetical protein
VNVRIARVCALLLASPTLAAVAEDAPSPIQDNSFLVEEAYNQEARVVQHISTFQRDRHSKDWLYTFTQEWPMGGQTNQFSFTLPAAHQQDVPGARTGIGDVALNYRYQWLGDGDSALAVSPRLSLLVPTGDAKRGRGAGAPGVQVQLPLSWVVAERLVAHTNVGWTYTPNATDGVGHRADLAAWNAGQSLIWLATQNFNVMVECVHTRSDSVAGDGQVTRASSTFVSPGIRWAHNLPSGLQIVPGIAVPIGIGASRSERSVFLYLSFEHPY